MKYILLILLVIGCKGHEGRNPVTEKPVIVIKPIPQTPSAQLDKQQERQDCIDNITNHDPDPKVIKIAIEACRYITEGK